jgi:hypothetical protein
VDVELGEDVVDVGRDGLLADEQALRDLAGAEPFRKEAKDIPLARCHRIDVTDNGESGTNDSYGIIVSNGYASGQQQLQGGNVKIHKT